MAATDSGHRVVVVIQSMLVLIMVFFLHENHCIVQGRNITADEYLQMKKIMKSLNKPAVKSIQTEFGDLYDCVDIYKQPAFDHPLLQNHTIQMPTSYPKGRTTNHSSFDAHSFGFKDGGCPNGTVPIRRTRMEDLMRAKSLAHFGKKVVMLTHMHAYAIARAPPFRAYHGTRVYMNVWNPKVPDNDEISVSQLWIKGGPDYQLNTIEVGWIVNPEKYGDNRTRLFVYWTGDGYDKTGCFNLDCPGFVHLNPNIPVDVVLDRVSKMHNYQYDIKIDVFRDTATGNWYLNKNDLPLGYWPKAIFNDWMSDSAQNIEWGGEVTQCPNCEFPEMGSGLFPRSGYGLTAYMQQLQVIEDTNMVLTDVKDCSTIADRPKCYEVELNTIRTGKLKGYHFTYGGPGGKQC